MKRTRQYTSVCVVFAKGKTRYQVNTCQSKETGFEEAKVYDLGSDSVLSIQQTGRHSNRTG
jgi:hypothetical protein